MIVNVELLIGKKVVDADGKVAGRLHDVHGDWRGSECVITYYTLWPGQIVVTWDQMDLSDPERPRVKVRAEELRKLKTA